MLDESEQSHCILRSGRVIIPSGHYAITVDLTRPAQNETAALRRNTEFSAPLNYLGNMRTGRLSQTSSYNHLLKILEIPVAWVNSERNASLLRNPY